MIEEIRFAEPDHDPSFVNEEGEEVCPECENVVDDCACVRERGNHPQERWT
jgi:hypothetical protein